MKYPQKQGSGGLCTSFDFLPAFYIFFFKPTLTTFCQVSDLPILIRAGALDLAERRKCAIPLQ